MLLKHNPDASLSTDEATPLYIACEKNFPAIVVALLNYQPELINQSKHGFTPLLIACINGHLSVVEELLRYGANINQANDNGFTPLYAACRNKSMDIVRVLLAHEADINLTNHWGRTPLQNACINNDHELIKLLVNASHNKELNLKGVDNYLPTIIAYISSQHSNIKLIAEDNFDLSHENDFGQTAFDVALELNHQGILLQLIEIARTTHANPQTIMSPESLEKAVHSGLIKLARKRGRESDLSPENQYRFFSQLPSDQPDLIVTAAIDDSGTKNEPGN